MPKAPTTKKRSYKPPKSTRTAGAARRIRPARPAPTEPRVTVGTALCHAGLDELAIGKRWVRVIRNLAQKKHRENLATQKLLFDVLKECTRQLDNDHEPAGAANVFVRLVHAVPRPPRVIAALASANPPETESIPTNDPQQQEPL
jgi:hypothetical protein